VPEVCAGLTVVIEIMTIEINSTAARKAGRVKLVAANAGPSNIPPVIQYLLFVRLKTNSLPCQA